MTIFGKPLVDAGYTLFALNHRTGPRFRYPAPIEDIQRAVRFIRYHGERFGIRPERIGGSSGGHLIAMVGVLDGKGDPDDPDPVNRQSAKLHCFRTRLITSTNCPAPNQLPSVPVPWKPT